MNDFLKDLEDEIEEEKKKNERQSISTQSVTSLWGNRTIPQEDKDKFSALFQKADVKHDGSVSGEFYRKLICDIFPSSWR
jgi:lipid II:glycine glycyltransferase (peptidoglycan interpeptide bridge formation enzyme)